MRQLLSFVMLLMVSSLVYAQQDVTRFLGIPVDGNKEEMVRKLKTKGFKFDSTTGLLTGEFNGTEVNVNVVTNNNKVYRIVAFDVAPMDERAIQIRFNKLCRQFANNSKYMTMDDYTIPDDEDLSYEMTVHKKRYEAVFLQRPEMIDSIAYKERIRTILSSKYTDDQLDNPNEEIQADIMRVITEDYSKRPVWFMISEQYGEYYIAMYYDNEYNHADGEDL